MSRCQKCNVIILDHTDRCPLCKHVLEEDGTSTEDMYPNAIAVTKRFRFLENLFLFLSILIAFWFPSTTMPTHRFRGAL